MQPETDKLTKLYVFFLFMYQAIFRVPDAALGVLFLFFAIFLNTVGACLRSEKVKEFAAKLPRSIHTARLSAGRSLQPFKKYVCCRTCHTLYEWDKCVIHDPDKSMRSRLCDHINFPSHPQRQHRQPCNTPLMKKVQFSSGSIRFVPHLVYCYKSIIESLQEMIMREGFLEQCEKWRKSPQASESYRDVYDGKIWKEFQVVDGQPFLSISYNFALHLNVDWFQPYKHTRHSEGVMYVTVLNLPRSVRFLQENVIVLGVIPGPHEPKKNINSFLDPFVADLKKMWDGVVMRHHTHSVLVRAALLCVGCDIPAARKVCGFLGHSAFLGCSKCLAEFPTKKFGEKPDYSNFSKDSWTERSGIEHKSTALKYKQCNTKAQQKEIERESGVRYSVLVELPYFNAPRMCIVDPMHNLLLGTAKHMLELWKNLEILTDKDFELLQTCVDSFVCPGDVGRLPYKILSGFSSFTAEQWKSWTCLFSLSALKGVLPWRYYQHWQLFVKACYLLCRREISEALLVKADELIIEFCQRFVSLYGKEHCTMNMHLHVHLSTCVRDFGPVYSFWLFSFERMNGVMGAYHTNNHLISVQLMQRFLDYKRFSFHNWPEDLRHGEYSSIIKSHIYQKGSLVQDTFESSSSVHVKALPPVTRKALSAYEIASLSCWSSFNSGEVLALYRHCRSVCVGDIGIGSRYKSSVVCAQKVSGEVGLGEVCFFGEVHVKYGCETKSQWIAAVRWYEEHPCKVWFGYPVQVWFPMQVPGYSLIPLSAITTRVVHSKMTVNFGRHIGSQAVIVAVPLEHRSLAIVLDHPQLSQPQ